MNSSQFRTAAHDAVDEIIDYFETIQDRRVASAVEPAYLRQLIPLEAPQEGEAWPNIQKDIEEKIMPGMTHWQSPNFMAWYPVAMSYPGILGELYSAALSAPAFNWQCSPAMTELETIVLDWLAELLHLPACFQSKTQGGGVIQGSASEAVVTVMVAARERYVERACGTRPAEERDMLSAQVRGRLVALGSEQSHSSTAKAAKIAGVKFRSIKTRLEDDLALTGQAYREALEQCKAEGLEPFYLTATLGTTATCAIDHFESITAINEAADLFPPLWIHIDAAYAGAALLLEEYTHLTKALHLIDSFDMNMHKWLLVNFDCSCLFVRNRRALTDVLTLTPSYLRHAYSDSGLVTDYRDWQIPLGRRFRSLKIWFVIRSYGAKGLQAHVRRHIDLGKKFADWVERKPNLLQIIAPPAFAMTVIRVLPRGSDRPLTRAPSQLPAEPRGTAGSARGGTAPSASKVHEPETPALVDQLTEETYHRINASGKLFLTSGVVNGLFAIRMVSANWCANEESLRAAFDLIVQIAEEVVAEHADADHVTRKTSEQ